MAVKERPILMAGSMAQGCYEGWKRQTRRPMKPQPVFEPEIPDFWRWKDCQWVDGGLGFPESGIEDHCPYGKVGDRLWVRETWSNPSDNCLCDGPCYCDKRIHYRASCQHPESIGWTSSIHMPRWACRTVLEVTGIRVERVQGITEEDAKAEGVVCAYKGDDPQSYIDAFHALWDSIYAKRGFGWDVNPWVWVGGFKRVVAVNL